MCKFLINSVMRGFNRSKEMRADVEREGVNLANDVQERPSFLQSGLLLTKVSQTKVSQTKVSLGKLKSTDRFNELLAELRRQEELFYGPAKALSAMDKN